MADNLKNRIRVSTTFQPEQYRRLKDFSNESGIPISKIIEKAIETYLNNQK